jgi:hypothetical protein
MRDKVFRSFNTDYIKFLLSENQRMISVSKPVPSCTHTAQSLNHKKGRYLFLPGLDGFGLWFCGRGCIAVKEIK